MAFRDERVFSRGLTTRTYYLLIEIIWYLLSYIFPRFFFFFVGNWLDDLSLCSDMCQHLNYHIPSHLSGSPSSLWWAFKMVIDLQPSLHFVFLWGDEDKYHMWYLDCFSSHNQGETLAFFFSVSVGLSHETTSFNGNDSLPIIHPYPQVHCDVTVSSVFLPASVSCLGKPTKCFSYILTKFLKEV